MPIGIMIDSIAIASGACIGAALSKVFPQRLAKSLSQLFALSAMAIGITLIVDYQQLSAVILSLILGTAIGEAFNLNHRANGISAKVDARFKQRFGNGPVDICIFINLVVMAASVDTASLAPSMKAFPPTMPPSDRKGSPGLLYLLLLCHYPWRRAVLDLHSPICHLFLHLFAGGVPSPFLDPVAMGDLSACAGVITMATGINLLWIWIFPSLVCCPLFC